MRSSSLWAKMTLVLLVCCFISKPAFGYVDPGVGHFLWQGLLTLLIGSLFYVRKGVEWVRSLYQPGLSKERQKLSQTTAQVVCELED